MLQSHRKDKIDPFYELSKRYLVTILLHSASMSPIKRGIEENPNLLPLKRLRGGGEDDFPPEEELFDDDLDEEMEPPEPLEETSTDDVVVKEVLKGSTAARWGRPPLPEDLSNATDLNVQWTDMDVVSGKPLSQNPNRRKKVVGSTRGHKVPILRAYGVNEAGHSVAIFVHGFTPYGFFALPPGYDLVDNSASNMEAIRAHLENNLRSTVRSHQAADAFIHSVQYVDTHKSIMGYETQHTKFLKVYLSLPNLVPSLKNIMDAGLELPGVKVTNQSLVQGMGRPSFAPFECNVPFVLRFMVDRDISGAGWLGLPKDTYQIRPGTSKETHCQVRMICVELSCFDGVRLSDDLEPDNVCLAFQRRSKSISHMMILSLASLKANGIKLRPFEFCRLTSNARAAKDTSRKPRKTR